MMISVNAPVRTLNCTSEGCADIPDFKTKHCPSECDECYVRSETSTAKWYMV